MEQLHYVFAVLLMVLVLFAWGRIRHDFVALIALFTLVIFGVVPTEKAFAGFGHPAVITVAAVLIIGKALKHSGVVDLLGNWVTRVGNNITMQVFTLSIMVASASAFMNNVAALAIFMPVALHISKKSGNPPSYLLMPIAFASLLGGLITLIGTPPNIIIATLRADAVGEPFGMFDFAPLGIFLSLFGVAFISLIGWRLLPKRAALKSQSEIFKIDDYITELFISKGSKVAGITIEELRKLSRADVQILGLVRNNNRIHAPAHEEELIENDIIILESDTEALHTFINDTGLDLLGEKRLLKNVVGSKNISISEAVVMADSPLAGNTASGLKMRSRYSVNLVAVSRKQEKIHRRLNEVIFRTGDVLMVQGRTQTLSDSIVAMGCLPLAHRELRIGFETKIALSLSIFVMAIVLTITGLLPVHISFPMAAAAMVLSGVLPLKDMYSSVNWSVIVLLGAMLPVGEALEMTGGATLIAGQILNIVGHVPLWVTLGVLLGVTMLLSGILNNAATVVLMAPIAIGIAKGIGSSIDPFLMAITIGASASFLTPIAHQSNTLVMGPGGYRFTDYARIGLPLSIIILALAIPLILLFWPA